VAQLAESGVNAAGFPADVADRPSLAATMEEVVEHFGTVDVLEYSPSSAPGPVSPAEVTVDDIQIHLDPILYGALTAAQAVLPAMLKTGSGTLLFSNGGGVNPYPTLAGINIAQAALRNWVLNLNATLAGTGVCAASIPINVRISASADDGLPSASPDEIAEIFWNLHT
jgi:NADP-dependent 3-hydroxy acid dehydrogenase YdfG